MNFFKAKMLFLRPKMGGLTTKKKQLIFCAPVGIGRLKKWEKCQYYMQMSYCSKCMILQCIQSTTKRLYNNRMHEEALLYSARCSSASDRTVWRRETS